MGIWPKTSQYLDFNIRLTLTYLHRNIWKTLTLPLLEQARQQNYHDCSASSRRLIGRRTRLQDGDLFTSTRTPNK
jgi:hypothetical protein